MWTFDRPRLVILEARGQETIYNYSVRDGYLGLTTAAGQDGWMKYELDGGSLRLAFHDSLRGKPESLEAVPGRTDPLLVVVRLVALR